MGSLHCVGMCGPLALWASGADQKGSAGRMLLPTLLYHFGRLWTYTLVGLIAGAIGQMLDWGGDTLGIQVLAARVVGSVMILVGLIATWRIASPWFRARWWHWRSTGVDSGFQSEGAGSESLGTYAPPKPNWLTRQLIRLRPRLFGVPITARALVVGSLTALLPCGWLYLFALLAAGTGSAVAGAILMAAFWLGSVPALISLVASTRLLKPSFRRAVPLLASILLIMAGAYTAAGRGMAELNGQWKVSSSLVDQLQSGHSLDSLKPSDIRAGMEQLVATPLPCCQANGESVAEGDQPPEAASQVEVQR